MIQLYFKILRFYFFQDLAVVVRLSKMPGTSRFYWASSDLQCYKRQLETQQNSDSKMVFIFDK